MNKKDIRNISRKILLMVAADQKMRRSLKFNSQIDKKNVRDFKKILNKYGWPKKSLFGKDVSTGSWLIVQHADHDIDFQNSCLKILKRLEKSNEIDSDKIAFLVDRVRINRGMKQMYGTQFYMNEKNELVPRPLSNPSKVESLRKKYGLSSLASYKKLLLQNIPRIYK